MYDIIQLLQLGQQETLPDRYHHLPLKGDSVCQVQFPFIALQILKIPKTFIMSIPVGLECYRIWRGGEDVTRAGEGKMKELDLIGFLQRYQKMFISFFSQS